MVKPYIKLSRPKHWLKNVFIFVPIMYNLGLFDLDLLLATVQAFVAFCLISSAVYAINDIFDVEKDRNHPTKNTRPIAAGQIKIWQAVIFATVLLVAGFALTIVWYGNFSVLIFAAVYVLLNLAYSFKLKHFAILDCFCIAAGFVIRIFVGGATHGGGVTDWLFLTIVAVSLFLAFGKRRGEMLRVSDGGQTREVLSGYNLNFLNGMVFTCAGLSVVFYSLWAMVNIDSMVYTVPLVIFIVCKYLLVVHGETSHGDPTSVILGDKGLVAAVGIFGILSLVLLYL